MIIFHTYCVFLGKQMSSHYIVLFILIQNCTVYLNVYGNDVQRKMCLLFFEVKKKVINNYKFDG